MKIVGFLLASYLTVIPHAFAVNLDGVGCKSLNIILDSRLNPGVVSAQWGTGRARNENLAVLKLSDCKKHSLDQVTLASPLARLSSHRLRGAPSPAYLVSADLTAEAGSYNGPLTIPYEIKNNHLKAVKAKNSSGSYEPIHLSITGKSSWKMVETPRYDYFLSVKSERIDGKFVIFYMSYKPKRKGWIVDRKSENGLWESDADFPNLKKFPP